MGTGNILDVNGDQVDDAFETGFEDSEFIAADEEQPKPRKTGAARKAIEDMLEEKRLRNLLEDDLDDTFEA